jgi:hypothetical protein
MSKNRSRAKRSMLVAAFASIVAMMLALMPGVSLAATSAAGSPAGPPAGKLVKVKMTTNCTDMSPDVHKYAVDHNYCPSSDGAEGNNVVTGNCGDSWLWIWDDGNSSAFGYHTGVDSAQGSIAEVSWNLSWYNWTSGASGGTGDSNWPWSTDWERQSWLNSGRGYITAGLSGQVILVWGGTCYIGNPTDFTDVV